MSLGGFQDCSYPALAGIQRLSNPPGNHAAPTQGYDLFPQFRSCPAPTRWKRLPVLPTVRGLKFSMEIVGGLSEVGHCVVGFLSKSESCAYRHLNPSIHKGSRGRKRGVGIKPWATRFRGLEGLRTRL
jgi:hypothetical protein